MALIKCPECGKKFSDKAPTCPNCGCPTTEVLKLLTTSNSDNPEKMPLKTCPYCDEPVQYDDDYCDNCGMRLTPYHGINTSIPEASSKNTSTQNVITGLRSSFNRIFHFTPSDSIKTHTPSSIETSLPPLADPFTLPASVDLFKEWHIKLLRKLDNHPKKEKFSGIITQELDIPNFIPSLEKFGLITTVPYTDSLSLLTMDNLKQILRDHALKVSGKKQDLINRIIDNLDEHSIKNSNAYSDFYKLTAKGQKLVSDSYARFEAERIDFFKNALIQIMNFNFNDAYRMICKRNAEMPVPPGIGCDWADWYYSGLSKNQAQNYIHQLKNSDDSLATAIAIYSNMSGEANYKIEQLLLKAFPGSDSSLTTYHDEFRTNSIKNDLESLVECGVEKYIFLSNLDERTCPICGSLDGKSFLVKNSIIGKNCPPMHSGCRCTIISYIPPKEHAQMKRRARNPKTGQSELLPANMTYEQWKKSL